MQSAPKPANEAQRLAALERFEILDTLPQQAFDDITLLASTICGTPIALISLVDAERQWFKSRVGLDASQTSREVAFCSHAILEPEQVMMVEDATLDLRFHDNPLVREAPDIRFYAGAPIVTPDGFALGTVCVIDREARRLDTEQIAALRSLSRLVGTLLAHDKRQRDEAKVLANAAHRRNQYLMAIATQSLDLKAFIGPDYVYRYVNQTYLDYWARRREDVEGKCVADIMGEQLFRDVLRPLLDRALAGTAVRFEQVISFAGRGTLFVEVNYLPAHDETGAVIGIVVRVQDMQERKERELALRETVALLEGKTLEQQRFIHIVSHDLREPINTIVNFSSLLAEDHAADLPATARRYVDFICRGGERMKLLLDDLINFLRLDKRAIEYGNVDLNQSMAEVRADLDLAVSRSGASIEADVLPMVRGDASLLRILLQNLVANAIKFARPGVPAAVRIEAAEYGDRHEIRVHDNGIGIPDEQSDKVFDMFTRLHSRREFEGNGLGLSICRRVAELHGGRITLASTPGAGSCFTLVLPATVAPPQEGENT